MTKDQYMDICIRAAMRLGRYFRFYEAEFLPGELVIYDGVKYYPEKLIIGCDRNGNGIYTCRLHSLVSNSVVEVELSKVKGVQNGE